MGFVYLTSKRLRMLALVAFGLVFVVMLFHGFTIGLALKKDSGGGGGGGSGGGGLLVQKHEKHTFRKLLMSIDGDGDGVGSGAGNNYGGSGPGDGIGAGSGSSSGSDGGNGTINRIGQTCSKDNLVFNQGQTPPLPSGIPTYTVIIENVCLSGCSISNIHFSCGAFASARLINPNIFRRITIGDCLVNNGNPMVAGSMISFQYANTYRYPLEVSHFTCL